jgi:predicted nucleotidyltransferase
MERGDVIARLKAHRSELEALGVRRMFLFGSVAREAATSRSDVDLMVDLDEGPDGRKPLFSAFDVGGIQFAITEILGREVDLVVRADAMKPGKRLRAVAESQLVDVF